MAEIHGLSCSARRVRRAGALGLLAGVMLAGAGCAATGDAVKPAAAAAREFKCVGVGMDRRLCSADAARLCYTGFEFFEKEEADAAGVMRNGLHFRCNP